MVRLGMSRRALRQGLEALDAEGGSGAMSAEAPSVGARPPGSGPGLSFVTARTSPAELTGHVPMAGPTLGEDCRLPRELASTSLTTSPMSSPSLDAARDPQTWDIWVRRLHRAIVQASHNGLALAVYAQPQHCTRRGGLAPAAQRSDHRRAFRGSISADHIRIVRAIAEHDPPGAEKAMRDHLLVGSENALLLDIEDATPRTGRLETTKDIPDMKSFQFPGRSPVRSDEGHGGDIASAWRVPQPLPSCARAAPRWMPGMCGGRAGGRGAAIDRHRGDCFCLYVPRGEGEVLAFNGSAVLRWPFIRWYRDVDYGDPDLWALFRDDSRRGRRRPPLLHHGRLPDRTRGPGDRLCGGRLCVHDRVAADWTRGRPSRETRLPRVSSADGPAPAAAMVHRQPRARAALRPSPRGGRAAFYEDVAGARYCRRLQAGCGTHTLGISPPPAATMSGRSARLIAASTCGRCRRTIRA